jgi:hypothetical protein
MALRLWCDESKAQLQLSDQESRVQCVDCDNNAYRGEGHEAHIIILSTTLT